MENPSRGNYLVWWLHSQENDSRQTLLTVYIYVYIIIIIIIIM